MFLGYTVVTILDGRLKACSICAALPSWVNRMSASAGSPASLDEIAELSLSVGKMLLESGASARTVHQAIQDISTGLGCDRAESYCQHAAIIVMLRRGLESCVQMGKVGEHGVNLRSSEAIAKIVHEVTTGDADYVQARDKVGAVPRTTPRYPVWLVCVATGLACAAFGRLLHAEWLSFLPILIGASAGNGFGIRFCAESTICFSWRAS